AAWEERLARLGFMTTSPDGRSVCSIAGLVLFGRNPRRGLPQAGVRWMAFSGESKEYQAHDDALLYGPLVALTRGAATGTAEVSEPGLLERLLQRMTPFISTEPPTLTDSLRRTRQWYYPPDAIREALLSAFVQRDWTRSPEVEVVAYNDRLEITSPGALQNSMTIEKMLAGQRSPRNPLLIDTLRDYGYVDARGMGVRRKIVPLVRSHSGKDAQSEATEDFVRVTFPKAS